MFLLSNKENYPYLSLLPLLISITELFKEHGLDKLYNLNAQSSVWLLLQALCSFTSKQTLFTNNHYEHTSQIALLYFGFVCLLKSGRK